MCVCVCVCREREREREKERETESVCVCVHYAPIAHIARVNGVFIETGQKYKGVFGCQSRTVMVRDRDCTRAD